MSTAAYGYDLSPVDEAFARFVARHGAADADDAADASVTLLYHSALLVSAERAQGNSCVELAEHAGAVSPDASGTFTFPAVHVWRDALLASGHCAVPEEGPANDLLHLTPLVLDGLRLYLRRYHAAEARVARAIRSRVASPAVTGAALAASVPLFRRLFPHAKVAVDWQAVAAVAALRSSLVFVTGGPGTGKTTVAARLLALLLDRDSALTIAVAAPTGRAAARLTEAIGAAVQREQLEALVTPHLPAAGSTLHRLLGYLPRSERFRHHAGEPLPYDVVIVDEASMVDVLMMDALFAALRPDARLIVLGDPDQLASVDTGFVLGDVARAARMPQSELPVVPSAMSPMEPPRASATVLQLEEAHGAQLAADYALLSGGDAAWLAPQPHASALRDAVVRLRVSYRFGARPGIGALATAVQEGDADRALAALADEAYDEVALDPWPERVGASEADEAVLGQLMPLIAAFVATREPVAALAALSRFRLLCALRDGESGVRGLNALVERMLLREGRRVDGWYEHRPVLITANDAGMQLFNGDVGVTLAVDGTHMVHFATGDGTVRSLPPARLPAHETAWAMTVHKSQGSEFDHVRLVLPPGDHRILTRELLYTGITRARERVTVLGSAAVVRLATERSVARASGLVSRLTSASSPNVTAEAAFSKL